MVNNATSRTKRLVIAVDCDDVLLPSQALIIESYNQRYNTRVPLESAYDPYEPEWSAEPAEIARRIYEIQLSEDYARAVPFPDAVEVCQRLSEQHELHLVTARPDTLTELTAAMVERYFGGMFREIEHVGKDGSKGDICRGLRADVLIDDNAAHLHAAEQCQVPHLLWFGDYLWQTDASGGVVRCRDWYEVEEEIERIARN